jgi:uncharacterized OsmC-like protein
MLTSLLNCYQTPKKMTTQELKAAQLPLKEKYREEPQSALITLEAVGNVSEGISCSVETRQKLVHAGLHPATGGDGAMACSGDMLLQALVACAGVTLSAVATSLGVLIKSGVVRAEGDIDFRGTLGVSKETPVGFSQIRLAFDIDADCGAEILQTLAKLTERYCVVYQTLTNGTTVNISFKQRAGN